MIRTLKYLQEDSARQSVNELIYRTSLNGDRMWEWDMEIGSESARDKKCHNV